MNAIFAVDLLHGFGTGKDMPWPKSTVDLNRFRDLTMGHTVVMGANTWKSNMPKPLKGRRNCVLSHALDDDRCEVFPNIISLMMNLKTDENVFVIGGASILWSLRSYIKRVYLTRFKDSHKCEVSLDVGKYLDGFVLTSREDFGDHTFDTYDIT